MQELQDSLSERENKVSALEEELQQLREEMKQQKEEVRTCPQIYFSYTVYPSLVMLQVKHQVIKSLLFSSHCSSVPQAESAEAEQPFEK